MTKHCSIRRVKNKDAVAILVFIWIVEMVD